MPAAKAQLGPAVAMVVVAVVAGWGRRFACSWPGSCEAVVNFAFVFAFVLASFQNAKPDGKTKPQDEKNTCRRKAET